jgi:transcriptional regulator with XRE-family HTH domain
VAVLVKFGARLRAARVHARFSQDEVARFLQVGVARVVAWERKSERDITVAHAAKLSRMLGVAPELLFGAAALAALGTDIAAVAAAAASVRWTPDARRSLRGPAKRPRPFNCPGCGRFLKLSSLACCTCGKTPAANPAC